jgi:two-component system, cell cycle response regulator
VLLAVLVRLWSGGGQRPTAYWLLGLAVVALLAADTGYGVVSLQGPFRPGSSIDIGFIVFPLCCGAAALHPSMAVVAAPGTAMASRRPRWRLALLGGAAILAPPSRCSSGYADGRSRCRWSRPAASSCSC